MWIDIFILTLASMNKNNKFIFIFYLYIHTSLFFIFLLFIFLFFLFFWGWAQLSPCGLDSASPARSLAQASDLAGLSNTRALTHACCYIVQVN
jgi:hypothetical protein